MLCFMFCSCLRSMAVFCSVLNVVLICSKRQNVNITAERSLNVFWSKTKNRTKTALRSSAEEYLNFHSAPAPRSSPFSAIWHPCQIHYEFLISALYKSLIFYLRPTPGPCPTLPCEESLPCSPSPAPARRSRARSPHNFTSSSPSPAPAPRSRARSS